MGCNDLARHGSTSADESLAKTPGKPGVPDDLAF
jgi:hypothetical protein